jgi:hypothetical protein
MNRPQRINEMSRSAQMKRLPQALRSKRISEEPEQVQDAQVVIHHAPTAFEDSIHPQRLLPGVNDG